MLITKDKEGKKVNRYLCPECKGTTKFRWIDGRQFVYVDHKPKCRTGQNASKVIRKGKGQ